MKVESKLNSQIRNKVRSILLTYINSELQKVKRQTGVAKINSRSLHQYELEQYGNISIELKNETFVANASENIKEVTVLTKNKINKISTSTKLILQQMGGEELTIDLNSKKTTLSFQKMQRFTETVLKQSMANDCEPDDKFQLNLVPIKKSKKIFTCDKDQRRHHNSSTGLKFLRVLCKKMKSPIRKPTKKYSRSFDKKEIKRYKDEKNFDEEFHPTNQKIKTRTKSIPCALLSKLDLEKLERLIIHSRRNTVKESLSYKLFPRDPDRINSKDQLLSTTSVIQESPLIHPSDTSDLSRVSSDIYNEGYSSSRQSTHEDFRIQILKCQTNSTLREQSNHNIQSDTITHSSRSNYTKSSKSTQDLFLQTSKSSYEAFN